MKVYRGELKVSGAIEGLPGQSEGIPAGGARRTAPVGSFRCYYLR
jgi:hypothetical protein